MIDPIQHAIRIIFVLFLLICPPAWGANAPSIAWGQQFSGLSLGISLKGNENIPQSSVHIYVWAKITDGKEPPIIDPRSISLMNYTPKYKSIQKASTNTDIWDKFRWERVSDKTYRSKLFKISSKPNGKWGVEATIPVVWRGKSLELKTGILEYTMR